ncbi:hypothetical protein AVEN_96518-1 [Araneus ventricosus]|uniref:Uncharacterized protein n=1 Tax=Araneus ventricosus TaxID=182803 RepID=A0A4Y2CVE4_ARAVE|nr:hypothetical protein AVEN_96518-1 [Araneus ventricosus]
MDAGHGLEATNGWGHGLDALIGIDAGHGLEASNPFIPTKMNGLEATYCGVDFFFPKKFLATRYSTESIGALSINSFMPRG